MDQVPKTTEDNRGATITIEKGIIISPSDIDVSAISATGAFDLPKHQSDNTRGANYWNKMLNKAATVIIRACQKQGNWAPCNPYKLADNEEEKISLDLFLKGKHPFDKSVTKVGKGCYLVTAAFALHCYKAMLLLQQQATTTAPVVKQ